MKIDRRSFLSFVVGGAAGTALTPLPWKLTDDLSIWTQMWPWTPVPADGEITYENSACSLCPGGCGISVRKVGDRAVKIEGMKGHPVNDGAACILGLAGLQLLYSPARVTSPMKKEDGKWKKVSWDEAVEEITEKLSELRTEGKSQTMACIAGTDQGTVPRLLRRFLTAYGSPNFMTVPSARDAHALTLKQMQGIDASLGFDAENADFVLSFGSGLVEGWGSPVSMFRANSAWQDKKAKLIQIEPSLSKTGAKADQWIAIKPGTETAFALGLANMLITMSLHSKDFVENNSEGFEGFKKLVSESYTPAKVKKITGVDEKTLKMLAKSIGKALTPVAVCGKGQGKTPGSLNEFAAVHALNALMGNINQKGGVWAVSETDYIGWEEPELDEIAQKGMAAPRTDGAGTEAYPNAKSLPTRLPAVINAAETSPVEVLLISGENPCYTLPGTAAVKKAFDKIPLKISFSSYMDESAAAADFILPNHTCFERYEDVPASADPAKSVITLSKPVTEPLHDTKHTGDVVLMMAKALGGKVAEAFPWDSYQACLEETMGDKWETLTEEGFAASDITAESLVSGKFKFFDKEYKAVAIEGDEKKYPLIIIPYDSMRLASGFIGNPPFLTKTAPDTVLRGNDIVVQINPETARSRFLFLNDGDNAFLSTPLGKAKVRVHLFEGIAPGVVAMPRGLGHTAYDDYLAGKGANVNDIVGPVEDPESGLDAAWGIRARLINVPV